MEKQADSCTEKENILLVVLPLWGTQIPPLGISCLKDFLLRHGYPVKTVDANIRGELKDGFNHYLETLKNYIPDEKRGNFYNISHEVVHNHMMAHINTDSKNRAYIDLAREIIRKTFFTRLDDAQVRELNDILDAYYQKLETYFLQVLEQEKAAVLGISVYSSSLPSSLFAFRLTRERFPHIRTVMGGGVFTNQLAPGSVNLEFFLEKTRNYIDALFIGEGELLFLKYLNGELPAGQRVFTREDLKGETIDLSSTGRPDYRDYNLEYYQHLAAYGSRSCPIGCTFCSEILLWGKYRKRHVNEIAGELIRLNRAHDSQLFLMCDSLLNPIIKDLTHALSLADVSIYLDGYLRADKPVCSRENTFAWRRGGFYRARLGLESGSPRILEMMEKKITIPQVIEAVSSLAFAGIKTTTYWIMGYPGETEEDFLQTLDLIERLKDDIYEADCNPFHYYLTGQVGSNEWAEKNKIRLLYPEEAKDMLLTQTWHLDCEPSREVIYQRVNRFVRHCSRLGIPNPYSMYDIYRADERWKKLHQNAVPGLVDFEDKTTAINENKHIKSLISIQDSVSDSGDFDLD